MSIQLIPPENEEYHGQHQIIDPDRHTEGGSDGEGTGEAGASNTSRSLIELPRNIIEVESKANNVVRDVQGVPRLIDENTFVEPSEYLDREESENKKGAVRYDVDRLRGPSRGGLGLTHY